MAFTPKPGFYTIDEINAFFSSLSAEINSKLGEDGFSFVYAGEEQVLAGDGAVVAGYTDAKLLGDLGLNNQPVINLARGTQPQDAVTLEQAREILGVA